MHVKRLLSALLALTVLAFAGCQSRDSRLGEISVTVVEIKPAADRSQALVTLRFINENIIPFGFSSSTHRLQLEGSLFGRINNTEPFGIAPTSTVSREMVLQVENPALLQQLLARGGASSATYQLESVLQIRRGEERLRVNNTSGGTLDLGPLASGSR